MTNLNMQPLRYDYGRTRYLPEHVFDCGHCQTPVEPLYDRGLMLVPGNFHRPGMSSLLCGRCARLLDQAEHDAMAEEADRP